MKDSFSQFKKNVQYFLSIPVEEKILFIKFLYISFLIRLPGISFKKNVLPNTFFDIWDIFGFKHQIYKLIKFNSYFKQRLYDPKICGIKTWEYGLFLKLLQDLPKGKLLDVGAGTGYFTNYLSSLGWQITAIDLPNPIEKPAKQQFVFTYNKGSVLSLPYLDESFDLVICISTLEHLGHDGKTTPPYSQLITQTKKALKEIARVTKRGGHIYITTDAYDPKKQSYDIANPKLVLGQAYAFEDLDQVFLDTLKRAGFRFETKPQLSASLISDTNRKTYRGRYFTTFSLFAKKL